MKLAVFLDSRVGGRPYNQDRLALAYTEDSVLLVLADGMGGHLQGEVAAEIVVDLLTSRFYQQARPQISHPNRFLVNTVSQANQAIIDYATDRRLPEVPSTTVVVGILQNNMLYWCHVGDSRMYMFDANGMVLRSRDHSQIQRMIDQGLLSEEMAKNHPDRNKIYNCLGAVGDPEVEIGYKMPVKPGHSLLLCSDGLWSQFEDTEMEKAFSGRNATQVMPVLMRVAEKRGGEGGDNLSAVAMTLLSEEMAKILKHDILDTENPPDEQPVDISRNPTLADVFQEIQDGVPIDPVNK